MDSMRTPSDSPPSLRRLESRSPTTLTCVLAGADNPTGNDGNGLDGGGNDPDGEKGENSESVGAGGDGPPSGGPPAVGPAVSSSSGGLKFPVASC